MVAGRNSACATRPSVAAQQDLNPAVLLAPFRIVRAISVLVRYEGPVAAVAPLDEMRLMLDMRPEPSDDRMRPLL